MKKVSKSNIILTCCAECKHCAFIQVMKGNPRVNDCDVRHKRCVSDYKCFCKYFEKWTGG